MSLNSFFPEQVEEIKKFTFSRDEVVRCIRLDGEMESTFQKVLFALDDDIEFPHALIQFDNPFDNTISYFHSLLEIIEEEYDKNSIELKANGVKFDPSKIIESDVESPYKFIDYATLFANSLPDSFGAVIVVIDPEEIKDSNNFKNSIKFLANEIKTPWMKFLVRDQRVAPVLEGLENNTPRVGLQTFYLAPEEVEKRVSEDLKTPGLLDSSETRRYLGMLAGFSFANKDYEKAIKIQTKWVKDAEKSDDPSESAHALYNLGNSYMADGNYEEATNRYCKACQICSDHRLDSLAPFIFTNLGLNLHRQGEFEHAFDSLKVARDMFKAQKQVPGEAHVVDCLAQIYALDKKNEKAESTWKYALKIYQGISSENFQDMKQNGIEDINQKLRNFYKNTNQSHKAKELTDEAE